MLVSTILHQNFEGCLVIIANKHVQINKSAIQEDIFDLSFNNITVYLFDDAKYFAQINPRDRCLNYIIFHEDLIETFQNIEKFIQHDNSSRYNNRKYLFLTFSIKYVDDIFKNTLVRSIPNIVVALIKIQDDQIESFEFYNQAYLGSKVSLLDNWYFQNNTIKKQNGVDLYP